MRVEGQRVDVVGDGLPEQHLFAAGFERGCHCRVQTLIRIETLRIDLDACQPCLTIHVCLCNCAMAAQNPRALAWFRSRQRIVERGTAQMSDTRSISDAMPGGGPDAGKRRGALRLAAGEGT